MSKNSLASLLILLPLAAASAQQPTVLKVEPPSWWIGHSINPVRLMIRGKNLGGARVEPAPGLSLGPAVANAAGTYLFVDARIEPGASPGKRALKVATADGTAEAPFEVLAPLPRAGRFQGFSQDDVIYLIMPDRFADGDPSNDDPPKSKGQFDRAKIRSYHGGDLQGIIDHLPYLKDLGATAVWLTPVYDNFDGFNAPIWYSSVPFTDYHGYEPVDYYALDEHLGDAAKLRELADKAHALGLKVILDQIANHTGPRHPWASDRPTPTWFHGDAAKHLANTWQIWTVADPHASEQVRRPTTEGWFADLLPDLNQDDPEVARYFIQNSLWWIGVAGLDGLRLDTLPYFSRPFTRDWMAAMRREYPSMNAVGEVLSRDPAWVAFFQGGKKQFDGIDSGVDSLFDYPLMDALFNVFVHGKPMTDLAQTLGHDWIYPAPDLLVTWLGSHDEPRFRGRAGADAAALKLAFAFLFTARGIPMIYYGDEIAMPGGGDPENRRDFPGGWPGDPRDAFTPAGRTSEEQSVFEAVRRLAHLRAGLEPLRRGRMLDLFVGEKAYAYARVSDHAWAVAAFNNGSKEETVECELGTLRVPAGVKTLKDRLGNAPKASLTGGKITMKIPARSAAVYAMEGL